MHHIHLLINEGKSDLVITLACTLDIVGQIEPSGR